MNYILNINLKNAKLLAMFKKRVILIKILILKLYNNY